MGHPGQNRLETRAVNYSYLRADTREIGVYQVSKVNQLTFRLKVNLLTVFLEQGGGLQLAGSLIAHNFGGLVYVKDNHACLRCWGTDP